jgi:hypothetical protein
MPGRVRSLQEIMEAWEGAVDFVEMCRAQSWCLDRDAETAITALNHLYRATVVEKLRGR